MKTTIGSAPSGEAQLTGVKDCLQLTCVLARETAGLSLQCIRIAYGETTSVAAQELNNALVSIMNVREALTRRFSYVRPKRGVRS